MGHGINVLPAEYLNPISTYVEILIVHIKPSIAHIITNAKVMAMSVMMLLVVAQRNNASITQFVFLIDRFI